MSLLKSKHSGWTWELKRTPFGGGGGGGGPSAPAPEKFGSGLPGARYTDPRASVGSPYQPSYTPQTATPFLQSIMAQHSGQFPQTTSLGLPSLQSMFGMQQKSSPLQGGLQQLTPMAPYVGSNYRPNMDVVRQNLNNVAPSVEVQQRQAAEEEARQNSMFPNFSGRFGGGG
jgi:hypothetical protein